MSSVLFESDAKSLKISLLQFRKEWSELMEELKIVATGMDKVNKDVNIAKVTGAAAGIVGGVLAGVGFGLSFFTFGASLGLVVVGSVVAGAGGITGGGASIGDFVQGRKAKQRATEVVKQLNDHRERLLIQCRGISEKLEKHAPIETTYPLWEKFWGSLIIGSSSVAWSVTKKILHTSISTGLKVSAASKEAVAAGGATVFRTLSTASKGIHVVGGVAGILLIPLDIYFLVDSSIDIAKKKEHRISAELRVTIKELEEACPTEEDIGKVVDELISSQAFQDYKK